jgi:hypothetical protein
MHFALPESIEAGATITDTVAAGLSFILTALATVGESVLRAFLGTGGKIQIGTGICRVVDCCIGAASRQQEDEQQAS